LKKVKIEGALTAKVMELMRPMLVDEQVCKVEGVLEELH
jgi:hypothetical protein